MSPGQRVETGSLRVGRRPRAGFVRGLGAGRPGAWVAQWVERWAVDFGSGPGPGVPGSHSGLSGEPARGQRPLPLPRRPSPAHAHRRSSLKLKKKTLSCQHLKNQEFLVKIQICDPFLTTVRRAGGLARGPFGSSLTSVHPRPLVCLPRGARSALLKSLVSPPS